MNRSGGSPNRFKQLRIRLNLTQEELARKLNVSVHTVWRLEHANHKPQPLLQEKLDKLLKKAFPTATS